MEALEAKVSVENVLHELIASTMQKLWDDHGLQVNQINVSWETTSVKPFGSCTAAPMNRVAVVNVDSTSHPDHA